MKSKKTSQNVTLFAATISFLVNLLSLLVYVSLTSSDAYAESNVAPADSAQTSTQTIKKQTTKQSSLDEKKSAQTQASEISAGFTFAISRSTSLINHEDGTQKNGVDLLFNPSLKFGDTSFAAKAIYSRDLHDSQASDWSDTALSLGKPIYKWTGPNSAPRSLGLSLIGSLPTSKDSSKRQSLQGTIGASTSLTFRPQDSRHGLTSAFALSAFKLLHKYDTALDGKVNNSYGSNQTLSLNWQSGRWILGGEFIHKIRWSYQGTNKNSFEHTEELAYELSDSLQVAMGHTNAGAVNKANGNSDIELVDANESQVYGSMTLGF